MSDIIRLLAPGCSSQPLEETNEKRFSSAIAHLVTSLAIATIIGVCTALAAYFLTHGVVMWTTIGGGGGALISGLAAYVILRCAFGRISQNSLDSDVVSSNSNDFRRDASAHTGNTQFMHGSMQLTDASSSIQSTAFSDSMSSRRADLKGTVYIHSLTSGPIRKDRHFEFTRRLKTEEGDPIDIQEEDICLELDGVFEGNKKFLFRDSNNLPTSFAYLPASLFKEVKEGGTVRFIYNGKLIELSCRQMEHPMEHPNPKESNWTFEDFLKYVRRNVQYAHTQALWKKDVEGEPTFMGELVGQSLVRLEPSKEKTEIQDFQFYENDQKIHGAYQKLQMVDSLRSSNAKILIFNIHRDQIDISEIDLIESKGVNGLHQFWILIPHKPEKNQFPENTQKIVCGYGDHREQTFYKDSFDPQKGDRLALYKHGQYYKCSLLGFRDPKKVKLFFNESGWLQFSIEV